MTGAGAWVGETTVTDPDRIELVTSELLQGIPGVAHGFTTRHGGVSAAPFNSLNLSTRVGDERAAVDTNRRKVLEVLGRPGANLITLRQVHGDQLVQVSHLAGRSIEADGLWTRDDRAVVGVLVADCVPILIAHVRGEAVGAVHAGWRGTQGHIAGKMIKRMHAAGFDRADLRVALGPAIGPCCFEIGPEVAESLRQAFPEAGDAVRVGTTGKLNADLWALNRQSLLAVGVAAEHIDTLRVCTSCEPKLFSHRRDQGNTGRQGGVIARSQRSA